METLPGMTASEDLLTITIPVWERTDFFAEALRSALDQTMPVRVWVVDNASSHPRFEEAVRALGHPLVRYSRNARNLGMYGNWNRCAELAETPFFMILGDDDALQPTFAEKVCDAIRAHPGISSVYCDIERFGDRHVDHPPASVPFGLVSGANLLKSAASHGPNFPSVAMALHKNLFARDAFVACEPALSQDWLFVYRALADKTSFGLPERLVRYRVHQAGNAPKVGARAYLSTALILEEIADRLSATNHPRDSRRARKKSRWIARNAWIAGHATEIREMLAWTNPNPFTPHLRKIVAKDRVLRTAMALPRPFSQPMSLAMRLWRKLSRA